MKLSRKYIFQILMLLLSWEAHSQVLTLPPKDPDAMSGSEFALLVEDWTLEEREAAIYREIMSGNVPDFLRKWVPITFSDSLEGETIELTLFVLPDYLAIGHDSDYFLIPMMPSTAQKIADATACILPTRKMVDIIWKQALVKVEPSPIPPSPAMTTIPVMYQHNQTVLEQRKSYLDEFPPGNLVAGHKKDVVISNKIYVNTPPSRVAIYGWHHYDGRPIQPLYAGHHDTWVDYSHGIRLVLETCILNGKVASIREILKSETLHSLLSDEGVIENPSYPK